MNPLKSFAKQTAIYGVSSILARLLNYLLVPFHTYIFTEAAKYGIVTEMYSYSAILLVILTFGMETTFFRFAQTTGNRDLVYGTTLRFLLPLSSVFLILALFFSQNIAGLLRFPNHPEYVILFALIVVLDTITTIPFARLRAENKASRFAKIRIVNILFNIGFNIFFLWICPMLDRIEILHPLVSLIYKENIGITYIFISNLLASAVSLWMLLPQLKQLHKFDKNLFKQMFWYAFPLLIFGLAGSVNEVLDRILIKYLLPPGVGEHQLGIYGACYKISILITIVVQAFKYAAEPFFFAQSESKNAKETYARLMKYFVIFLSFLTMGILLYLDFVQYFVGKSFREGIHIVPILLYANIFLGIFYNLSVWYKLSGKTQFGAYISIVGAFITIGLNVWFIPVFGYTGSAWATFFCYFTMMLISYVFGQKYYPINYHPVKLMLHLGSVFLVYYISTLFQIESLILKTTVNTILMLGYSVALFYSEKEEFMAIKESIEVFLKKKK